MVASPLGSRRQFDPELFRNQISDEVIEYEKFFEADPENLPTFLHIGAAACGTTWVHAMMKQHPKIGLPDNPNAPFKEFEFWFHTRWVNTDTYLKVFREEEAAVKGEFSPIYSANNVCLKRISLCLPDIKLLFAARNPVSAINSYYFTELTSGGEPDFFRWFSEREQRMRECYEYDRIANEIEGLFPTNNIRYYIYENIVANPISEMQKIFSFLGVNDTYVPININRRYNTRYIFKLRRPHLLFMEALFRIYGGVRAKRFLKNPELRPGWVDFVLRLNSRPVEHGKIEPRIADFLRETTEPWCTKFMERHGVRELWGHDRRQPLCVCGTCVVKPR